MTVIKTTIVRRRMRIRLVEMDKLVQDCIVLLLPKWRCAHIQYLLVGIRLKVEGFSGFLKQNKILNTAMKMKMRSFSLRS